MSYSQDMWVTPIVITSANNSFRLYEITSTAERIVTIAAGTYWLHADSAYTSEFPSLYLALETALNAVATNTYAFTSSTPTSSAQQTACGLTLTGDVEEFSIDFDDADFTMSPGWFGFRASGAPTSSTLAIASPYTIYGHWWTNTVDVNGRASTKRRDREREISFSHDRPADRYGIEWYDDYTRQVVYEFVPAAHIFEVAATDSAYAATGRLATNDTHNAWETIWSSLSRSQQVIIVHDVGTGFDITDLTAGYAEAVLLRDESQAQQLSSTFTLTRAAGEFYTIDVNLWIVPDASLPGYNN